MRQEFTRLSVATVNVRTHEKKWFFFFKFRAGKGLITLSGGFIHESRTETDSYLNGFVENKCIENKEKYRLGAASKHAVSDGSENI